MAEKWTNTSSPVERWIKPYPFAPLNHFTVPFSLTSTPFAQSRRIHLCGTLLNFPEGSPPQSRRQNRLRVRGCLKISTKTKSLPTVRPLKEQRHKAWKLESRGVMSRHQTQKRQPAACREVIKTFFPRQWGKIIAGSCQLASA